MRMILFFFIIFSSNLYSQIVIKGRVIDEISKKGVANVNVFIKNDRLIGVLTNDDGDFSIKFDQKDTLYFSHISYHNNFYVHKFPKNSSPVEIKLKKKGV